MCYLPQRLVHHEHPIRPSQAPAFEQQQDLVGTAVPAGIPRLVGLWRGVTEIEDNGAPEPLAWCGDEEVDVGSTRDLEDVEAIPYQRPEREHRGHGHRVTVFHGERDQACPLWRSWVLQHAHPGHAYLVPRVPPAYHGHPETEIEQCARLLAQPGIDGQRHILDEHKDSGTTPHAPGAGHVSTSSRCGVSVVAGTPTACFGGIRLGSRRTRARSMKRRSPAPR